MKCVVPLTGCEDFSQAIEEKENRVPAAGEGQNEYLKYSFFTLSVSIFTAIPLRPIH
jgi:hypothetical protein